jgi:hypothetical protein
LELVFLALGGPELILGTRRLDCRGELPTYRERRTVY